MFKAGELQDLLGILKDYKIESFWIFSLVVFVYFGIKNGVISKIFTFLIEKYIDYFIKKKNSTTIPEVTMSEITNHDIFSYIDFWRYSKIPTLRFSSEYRNIVFRKYLSLYLKSHKDKIQSYINSKAFIAMTDAELWKSLLTLINDIVYSYESEMASAGIPKIVVEKMKTKNNDWINLTVGLIENISTSQFYKSENNYLKVYSVLNILLSILENTIHSSETVCNSINGELKGQRISDGGIEYKEP